MLHLFYSINALGTSENPYCFVKQCTIQYTIRQHYRMRQEYTHLVSRERFKLGADFFTRVTY